MTVSITSLNGVVIEGPSGIAITSANAVVVTSSLDDTNSEAVISKQVDYSMMAYPYQDISKQVDYSLMQDQLIQVGKQVVYALLEERQTAYTRRTSSSSYTFKTSRV